MKYSFNYVETGSKKKSLTIVYEINALTLVNKVTFIQTRLLDINIVL